MEEYRVFISYSHEDTGLVEKVVKVLEGMGLKPMWDRNFAFGRGFPEQIKTFIAHAHVFVPVITRQSSTRGWVHQEIGYAMALNVPVLPLVRGMLPGEMLQELHAVKLGDSTRGLENLLTREVFENLISNYRGEELAIYECAELPEDRTSMMVKYANAILKMGERGCVRQKGGLSSFNIPSRVLSDLVWKVRYEPSERSKFYKRLQRNERLALEAHARASGCRLIVNPYGAYTQFSAQARAARLRTLLEFLESVPDDRAQVAFDRGMEGEENITIVGDWFAAESVSMTSYRQTVFTRHAPSMASRIEYFDQEFEELLQKLGWTAESSRSQAVKELKAVIAREDRARSLGKG